MVDLILLREAAAPLLETPHARSIEPKRFDVAEKGSR